MSALTQARLKELLHYEPETGVFTWLPRLVKPQYGKGWNTRFAGKQAGSIGSATGYRRIKIDKHSYMASRLAWFYIKGEFPPADMDHQDLKRANNCWINLRPATRSQNCANKRVRGKTLPKGVAFHRQNPHKPFQARIYVKGHQYSLGYFSTEEQANAAYADAARKYFGEFARVA